ncbi:LysM peptidoglycan-binding domain-containing protein [Alicyclobacillus herbarius]|uniref:LysM peptidoglycan-binding domain-containing protein n=1 Tax=Alicyclobacillus herbarius TaxID=122960 RepID=UPI0023570EBA|nr:LysM peptidoglycan-binding domain-containing protein [Alicyclobacillus herbarius]
MRFSMKKWSLSLAAAGSTMAMLSVPALASTRTYTIHNNDTFWSIAHKQHIPLSQLLAANSDVNPLNLYPGLKVQLPEKTRAGQRQAYTITKGDTFWKLSRRLGVSLQSVLALNPGVDPYHLQPGMTVWLPKGPQAAVKTTDADIQVPSERHAARAYPKAQAGLTQATTSVQTSQHTQAASNAPVSYTKEITCTASAYTAAADENGWGPVDYYGHPLKVGTIAVDPSVIPLGSTVYITGYSFDGLPAGGMIAHATDVGSAIDGNRIDIYVPTSQAKASQFGLQQVKVYILK